MEKKYVLHTGTINRHIAEEEHSKIHRAKEFYASFLEFVETLFIYLPKKERLDINSIVEKLKIVWEATQHDRNFLIRVLHDTSLPITNDVNYLVSHSVRSAIISIIIGSRLKLSHHKLNELGLAALLHDAGMLMMPQEFYTNGGNLTAEEKKLVMSHPVHGYKLLKRLNCPQDVILAVLEHHEREDGSGYPRNLAGNEICMYAKIIAVACSYEALSAKRSYKEAKDTHTGIMELLRNEGKRYDDAVVRALVYSLSIYPIGTFVLLSDGNRGLVVDANPENPQYPLVQLLEQADAEKKTTINTSVHGISIVRPLNHAEKNLLPVLAG